ncbi:MAG TPA: PHP domain-containing protein [Xanthobacteraceae bacterium]|jgi:DNA polymerase (family 10)
MPSLDSAAVAALLREYGRRSALRGGNPYRAKAYLRAADSLGALTEPLDRMIAQGRLREIPGVGDAIADIITKLQAHGTHPSLEAMRKETPAGVLEMLTVPGLRPDKVVKLHKELGIASLAELETAAKAGRIKGVKGLGGALQARILQNIEIGRSGAGRLHMHRALALLENAQTTLREAHPELTRLTPAGDFRRGCELVGDLAVVAQAPALENGRAVLRGGGALSVHLADKAHYGAALLFATGSQTHVEALQALARERGMTLTADGLKRGRRIIAAATETRIYAALGLPFIPPELREGRDEIARARKGVLPRLVEDGDLRGILHAHTDSSDGVDTLEVMAEATRARGYQYFGVADHSKSAHYAGGLSVEAIEAQHRAIDKLDKRFGNGFRVFKGIESDILGDGALDYPDAVLDRFDFVVASVHSRFKMDRKEQTQRIIRAVANPYTTILGHMTGRQLLRRPGYEVDVEAILAACAAHGVAVEINANPWRLDLDWRWHQRALDLGCMVSINPDAHSTRELDLTHWGVEMARKGGVPADRVLNCLTLARIRQHFNRRKRKAHKA